jgi:hypothetical protein
VKINHPLKTLPNKLKSKKDKNKQTLKKKKKKKSPNLIPKPPRMATNLKLRLEPIPKPLIPLKRQIPLKPVTLTRLRTVRPKKSLMTTMTNQKDLEEN